MDERAQLARAAPGVAPVDSSEEGAPVPELIQLSVLGEPLINSLQEPMPAEERLEYVIQATALIREPLEQVRYATCPATWILILSGSALGRWWDARQ